MFEITEKIAQKLKEESLNCTTAEADATSAAISSVRGKNFPVIDFYFLSRNETHLIFHAKICRVPEEKFDDMLVLLNQINRKHRHVMFYLDKDRYLMVQWDMLDVSEPAEEIAWEILVRCNHALDEVYPQIMKTLYA